MEREIKTQILAKYKNKYVRTRALEKERTLDQLLELIRNIELSEARSNEISQQQASGVHRVEQHRGTRSDRTTLCYNCGYPWPHDGKCPAAGKECRRRGEMNHFAQCCRTPPRTHTGETVSSTSRSKASKGKYTGEKSKESYAARKVKSVAQEESASSSDSSDESDSEENYVYTVYQYTEDSSDESDSEEDYAYTIYQEKHTGEKVKGWQVRIHT